MSDRFDLEQQIMECWSVVEDIKMLYEYHCDGHPMTKDDIDNVLLGLSTLYQMKFERMFGTFENLVQGRKFD